MLSSKFDLDDLHKISYKIENLLIDKSIPYKAFTHEAATTSIEASKLRPEYKLCQGVKALIVKINKKNSKKEIEYIQVVIPGDKKFNNSKMRKILKARSISFANADELYQITDGIKPGGVPPFGNLFNLDIYADKTIIENLEVIFNCGDRRASIAIDSMDYIKAVNPILCDIV